MTTSAVIAPYWEWTTVPFEFVGAPSFVKKLTIIEKKGDVVFRYPGSAPTNNSFTDPAYFLCVTTQFGDLVVEVSKEVFDLLEVGEPLIVNYRRGWFGGLKGKIAR